MLEEGRRVILPGFGTLHVGEQAAAPVGGEVKLSPPGKKILFDQQHAIDDGILATAIAGGEKIDQEEARQRVLEMTDDIRLSLDKGEAHELHGAGSFHRDGDGKISFVPEAGWILEPDQFGLEAMDLLELEPEEEKEPVAETAPAPEALEDAAPQSETRSEEKPEPEAKPVSKPTGKAAAGPTGKPTSRPAPPPPAAPTPPKEKKGRSLRPVWIVAAVLVVILAVLLLLPAELTEGLGDMLPFGNDKPVVENPETGGGDQHSEDQNVADLSGEDQAGTEDGSDPGTTEGTEAASHADSPVEVPAAGQQDSYFIIAGSFTNVQNASDLKDQLLSVGFSPEIMITENRLYRVSVASFETKQEALDSIWQIRAHEGLEGVWLLSN